MEVTTLRHLHILADEIVTANTCRRERPMEKQHGIEYRCLKTEYKIARKCNFNEPTNFVVRFLAQAQALTGEHVVLKYQQEGLNQVQQTAIMAVQGYAECGLKELASRQLVMAQAFQGELAPIGSSPQQQAAFLQKLQTGLGVQIKGEVSGMLNQAIRRVQQEIQSALEAQTQGATQLEKTLYTKVETGLKHVVARVQQQIDEQLTR
ncbi:unnamed protein product [Phytophthora fragariaefolia]|uniref:Unnamed protein product n=1 Tax=Phytophthora fragariaefolia TaxID=1490495 RepID=A0A9W6TZC7_9STRA|nr:unnamed protein product [Phytophthora fragariaefolia]